MVRCCLLNLLLAFARISVQTESRDYRVLYFVVYEEDNGDVFKTPTRTINLRLRELRRQRREMMLDGASERPLPT